MIIALDAEAMTAQMCGIPATEVRFTSAKIVDMNLKSTMMNTAITPLGDGKLL